MKKIIIFEHDISGGLQLTRRLTERVSIVKSKNIKNSSKILLCKQKLKNLIEIYNLVKVKINNCYSLYKETKKLKKDNKFSQLYTKLKEINIELDTLAKDLTVKDKKFLVLEVLKDKCNKKMFKLTNTCQNLFTHLCITRREEHYEEIFKFYLAQGNYIERLKIILKNNIFMVIKETFFAFSDDKMVFITYTML